MCSARQTDLTLRSQVLTLFTAFFLCALHAITVVSVRERVLISREDDATRQGGLSGALKSVEEIWTTARRLPVPIQQVLNVQFTSWMGWFPILFFSTTWVYVLLLATVLLIQAYRACDCCWRWLLLSAEIVSPPSFSL